MKKSKFSDTMIVSIPKYGDAGIRGIGVRDRFSADCQTQMSALGRKRTQARRGCSHLQP